MFESIFGKKKDKEQQINEEKFDPISCNSTIDQSTSEPVHFSVFFNRYEGTDVCSFITILVLTYNVVCKCYMINRYTSYIEFTIDGRNYRCNITNTEDKTYSYELVLDQGTSNTYSSAIEVIEVLARYKEKDKLDHYRGSNVAATRRLEFKSKLNEKLPAYHNFLESNLIDFVDELISYTCEKYGDIGSIGIGGIYDCVIKFSQMNDVEVSVNLTKNRCGISKCTWKGIDPSDVPYVDENVCSSYITILECNAPSTIPDLAYLIIKHQLPDDPTGNVEGFADTNCIDSTASQAQVEDTLSDEVY